MLVVVYLVYIQKDEKRERNSVSFFSPTLETKWSVGGKNAVGNLVATYSCP